MPTEQVLEYQEWYLRMLHNAEHIAINRGASEMFIQHAKDIKCEFYETYGEKLCLQQQ